jgi:hypothetical protein
MPAPCRPCPQLAEGTGGGRQGWRIMTTTRLAATTVPRKVALGVLVRQCVMSALCLMEASPAVEGASRQGSR